MNKVLKKILFSLESEKAHELALSFLRYFPRLATVSCGEGRYENLAQNICGLDFKNVVGMAAGFDKNAAVLRALVGFGFGFVEAGTVTLRPQIGNDRPRIFRLSEDEAIINRLGFNNGGAEVFARNLANFLRFGKKDVVLGVNIGKNKDSEDALADYLALLDRFYESADYVTVNISSPNTKNLRDLQKESFLDGFLAEIMAKRDDLAAKFGKKTPIWLKIAPDLDEKQQNDIAQVILARGVDAVVISNTTVDRAMVLKSGAQGEGGGLSGRPLFEKSNAVLRNFYLLTGGKVPLIGVGGVSSAQDAYEKIKLGASLVQIYSAFIYQGFGLVDEVNRGVSELLVRDGVKGVGEVVGVG